MNEIKELHASIGEATDKHCRDLQQTIDVADVFWNHLHVTNATLSEIREKLDDEDLPSIVPNGIIRQQSTLAVSNAIGETEFVLRN